jgi:phage major head subunit gpT-like protein
MAVMNSSNFAKDLFPGLNGHFEGELEAWPIEYTELLDTISSDKRYEEYVQRLPFGLAPIKTEGAAIQYDSSGNGYDHRVQNVVYGLGFKLTREAVEDNQYIELGEFYTRWLARSMRITKETVCANIYNRAFNSSFTYGDGKELLATDHPSQAGSQSNELAVAADLSEASIEDLCIQIMQAKDDRGNQIMLQATKLIVPTDLHFEATRILESELQNDSANNAINALKNKGAIPRTFVSHYLTDADAWFIRTNMPQKEGLILQERRALEFSTDNEFDNENLCYKATERYAPSCNSWRALYGSPGA